MNTNDVDINIKSMLKYDGVLCFGGIDNDNNMNNEIAFLNCINKENGL